MLWDAEYVLRQLIAAISGPRMRTPRSRPISSGEPIVSCVRCPFCQDFVQLSIADVGGTRSTSRHRPAPTYPGRL